MGLRVADSKFIKFRRQESGLEILQNSDDDLQYRPLKPDNLMYFSIHNENQNPYGTPLMRSCEFVSQILVTIQNSIKNVWERFGDPSFQIIYKTSKKDGTDLAARRQTIEDEFNAAIRAKREGKSADFIRAIDTNSEIEIKIIGADGQELESEVPARHMLEQIIAKTGLPPWMLGMHWSTTERLSNAETEMLLADVATRQFAKMPLFHNLVKTMLLLRGRTWKPGDWWLEFGNVNLRDIVQQAQARFLNAQADMYYLTNARDAGIEIDISDLAIGKEYRAKSIRQLVTSNKQPVCGYKELRRAFDWPELDRVEIDYEDRLKGDWQDLLVRVKLVLALEMPKSQGAGNKGPSAFAVLRRDKEDLPNIETFTFSVEQRAQIMTALKDWTGIYKPGAENSPVVWYYGQAYSLGLIQAAMMIGEEQPLLHLLKNREIFDELTKAGFEMVKNNATKAIVNKILPEMEAFALAGSNPIEAARRLEKLFGDQNANWQRLTRSEMSMAAERAKKEEWQEWGVNEMDFAPAPDACPMCMALKGTYAIDDCPLPVKDTHPNCRCSTRPAESEI